MGLCMCLNMPAYMSTCRVCLHSGVCLGVFIMHTGLQIYTCQGLPMSEKIHPGPATLAFLPMRLPASSPSYCKDSTALRGVPRLPAVSAGHHSAVEPAYPGTGLSREEDGRHTVAGEATRSIRDDLDPPWSGC